MSSAVNWGFIRATWLIAASVPALTSIALLPWVVARLFPPGVGATPEERAIRRDDHIPPVPHRAIADQHRRRVDNSPLQQLIKLW